jgi:hypothetical protein
MGLDRLLVAFAEHDREAGSREIERLIDHYPSQRMVALRAKARLIAREAADQKLALLDTVVAKLPEGDRGFLTWTPKLRESVGEICRVQQRLDTQDRPFLRKPTADLLCEKIKNFHSQMSGFPEPLTSEFRKAARRWLEVADGQHRRTRAILLREPTPQLFRAGDPVDRRKEAFVPRESVLGDLDRQLTLYKGCPGLILYGRRRMGKSTLLRNLDGFLPTSIRVVNMSMQDPDAFTSLEDFLNFIATGLRKELPRLEGGPGETTTLKAFAATLRACNEHLEAVDQKCILAIDEYENLDRKIGEGVFPRDLLDALRESIQFHRRLIWVFAGSHAIEELEHANWSSYLVSARTLEVPPFTEAETRRLLTEPLRYSPEWKKGDPKRPRFTPDFWGEDGIEGIHAEAGGWPHLVQLLAETTVDLCNDQEKAGVTGELLEQTMDKAIVLGDAVLRQLMQPEDASFEEWDYLRGFRIRDTQPIPESDGVYRALRRRLLVVAVDDDEWRLRVPLMQRWLRERG